MGGLSRPQQGLVFGVYVDGILCAIENISIEAGVKDVPSMSFEVAATYGSKAVTESQDDPLKAQRKSYIGLINDAKAVLTKTSEDADDINLALEKSEAGRIIEKYTGLLKVLPQPGVSTYKKAISWRHLLPNTKVTVLYRDTNWEMTRFAVFFEGEIMSTGFTRGAESRNVRFQAYHITQGMEFTALEVLDGAKAVDEVVTGDAAADGSASSFEASGNFILQLSPQALALKSGIPYEELSIYDFCRESLNVFNSTIQNSSVRNNYYAKAMKFYQLPERLYSPTPENPQLTWNVLYSAIMKYAFSNILPALGSRISYMSLISYITELFLHEFMIHPAAAKVTSQILIKPNNVFTPVPQCNVIFPIHGANYEHRESYRTKPTRGKQDLSPPNGDNKQLTRTYRIISPVQLREAFKEAEATGGDINSFDLTTDEEKQRGIIPSYNNLSPILTSILEMLTTPGGNGNVLADPNLVKGAGEEFSGLEKGSSTISGSSLSPEDQKAVKAKLYIHRKLLILEGKAKATQELTNAELLKLNSSMKAGALSYQPNRITIVPLVSVAALKSKKVNYTILSGVLKLVLGRQFHVFEEPTDSIPLMMRINVAQAELESANKQKSFMIGGSELKGGKLDKGYEKTTNLTRNKHNTQMSGYTSGGFHQSIVITLDDSAESKNTLVNLLPLLCQLCDIKLDTLENKGNIRVMSDYFGDTFISFNEDKELKANILLAKKGLTAIQTELTKVVGDFKPIVSSSNSAGSNAEIDSKLHKILSVNEATGEAKYKVNYNPNTPEFDFGGCQFVIIKSSYHTGWEKAGFTKAEIKRFQAILPDKKNGRFANSFTNSEQTFIQGINQRLRANKALVDKIDDDERKILVNHTIAQIRKYFFTYSFEGESLFGQLCDIYNQWGTSIIDSYKSEHLPIITATGNGKITKTSIYTLRIAMAKSPKSNVSPEDQIRRYTNIENIYKDKEGVYLSAEELIKKVGAAGSGGFYATTYTGAELKSQGLQYTEPGAINNSGTPDAFNSAGMPNVLDIKIQDVLERYGEPIGDYYFYLARYQNNQYSTSIAFNPYLYPGFSVLLLDSSELQAHVTGYLNRISWSQSASGSLSTQLQVGYLRRSDELGIKNDLFLTTGKDYVTVPEALGTIIPFFAGEYTEGVIEKTYDNVLGCPVFNTEDISEDFLEQADLKTVNSLIKRKMQYCKMLDAGRNQGYYDDLYKDNQSSIAAKFNGGHFPDRIHFIKDTKLVSELTSYDDMVNGYSNGEEDRYLLDNNAFNEETQELVRLHNSIINFNRAQKG